LYVEIVLNETDQTSAKKIEVNFGRARVTGSLGTNSSMRIEKGETKGKFHTAANLHLYFNIRQDGMGWFGPSIHQYSGSKIQL
jgi:hypothetical protein